MLGEALNEVFLPLFRQQFPEVVDFWLPPEGCSYRVAVVTIKKAYPGHAKRVMLGVWSYLRQFMYTKFVIVTDDDIDARDWQDVIWAISTRVDPARDLTILENTPIDYLDFASPESGLGSKLGIDATNKWPPETRRDWGTQDPHERRHRRPGHRALGRLRPARLRQADLEVASRLGDGFGWSRASKLPPSSALAAQDELFHSEFPHPMKRLPRMMPGDVVSKGVS